MQLGFVSKLEQNYGISRSMDANPQGYSNVCRQYYNKENAKLKIAEFACDFCGSS